MKGGFQLRKWAANLSRIFKDIPNSQHKLADHFLPKDETLKILGLSWLPLFFRDSSVGHDCSYKTLNLVVYR